MNSIRALVPWLHAAIVVGAGLIGAIGAHAQTEGADAVAAEDKPLSVTEMGLNFAVPDSPAFTILGMNPENVSHASSPRDFAAQILNGVDRDGNFQSGLAIDMTPWGVLTRSGGIEALLGDEVNLIDRDVANGRYDGYADGGITPISLLTQGDSVAEQWKKSRFLRALWYRTSLSFATTKGVEKDEDQSLRLAAGIRMVPWDPGDSVIQNAACVFRKVRDLEVIAKLVGQGDAVFQQLDSAVSAAPNDDGDPNTTSGNEAARIADLKGAAEALAKALPAQSPAGAPGTIQVDTSKAQGLLDLSRGVRQHLRIRCQGAGDCAGSVATVVADSAVHPKRYIRAAKGFPGWLQKYETALKTAQEESANDKAAKDAYASAPAPAAGGGGSKFGASLLALAAKKQLGKTPGNEQKAANRVAELMVDECKKENEDRATRSAWQIAVAPSWISATGATDDIKWNGGAAWTSLAIGPDVLHQALVGNPIGVTPDDDSLGESDEDHYWNSWQVILHARYRFDEQRPDGQKNSDNKESTFEQNGLLLGGRLRLLITDNIAISGEAAWIDTKTKNGSTSDSDLRVNDKYWQYSIIPSFKVPYTENVWFDVAIGTDSQRKKDLGNSAFVLSSIRYGLSQGLSDVRR